MFLQASTEFLAQAKRTDELPDLPAFEARRDAILKAIELYDRKVSEAVALLAPSPSEAKPAALIQAVEAALKEKDILVHRILVIDDQILDRVEAEKTKVLKNLVQTQKSAQIAQKFKSTWVSESGEEIDEKL
jgi:hypothetical protein